MDLQLSRIEIEAALNWFEYASKDSLHYGNGEALFPFEGILIKKLANAPEIGLVIDDQEIATIHGWMEQALENKYGSQTILLPWEQLLHQRLTEAMRKDPS